MGGILPPDLLDLLRQHCPCRETQILQLATYYNNACSSPSVLVTYGLEQSSKREVIANVLRAREVTHAVIKTKECLSQRHLLSKIFAACIITLGYEGQIDRYEKVDSINALLGNLRKLSERVNRRKFVVVIEDADELKQPGPTLLPALARLGDMVPGFAVILNVNSPRPLVLHKAGVPYVHFPPYTRSEAISIITSRLKPHLSLSLRHDHAVEIDETAVLKLYPQFVTTVYDSLIASTSSTSILAFQSTCDKLWPRFVEPIVSPKEATASAKPWTFSRLLVHHRGLFQSEGEETLHHTLTRISQRDGREDGSLSPPPNPSTREPPLLKHFPTLVLVSAYLASHTQQKHDMLLFSRMSSSSSNRRVRKTPTKRKSALTPTVTSTKETATPTKSPRTKSIFSAAANLGIPRPFTLERLVAILRAIHPYGVGRGRGMTDRIYRELGELEKLRLVVRASGAGGSIAPSEEAADEKWRVNVARDWVVGIGQTWGLGVAEYELDQDA
ncbi:origin recognition complex subunit Orc5 [Cladophialophora carrionii]|uniref:Origin recognition complex subunit Orc5 n=1 Tax=Cladophialophora carrionii TaxID=86049 RepID=A0A1C1CBM6_9EURO|nr:origin recognition complex subunit Orc5 [Cladophialophora carrionii]